jgi:ATP-binding cassette, subfamily B, bacterial
MSLPATPDTRPRLTQALHLVDAVRLVWRATPGWTVLTVSLAVVQGVLPLFAVYLMKLIVDAVTQGITQADHAAAFRTVAVYIVLAAAVGLVAALLRSLGAVASEAMGQVVTDHVSDLIHAKSIAVDLEYYENAEYYDTLQRAQNEAPSRPTQIVNDLLTTGQSVISVIAMAGLLFTLQWSIALVVVLAAIPGALVRVRYSHLFYDWQRGRTSTERQAWYTHWLLISGPHAKEVRLFGLGELFRGMYRDLRRILRTERIDIAKRRAAADFAAGAVAVLAIFGTFAYIVWETIIGAITLGSMVMYYQAFQTGLSSLQAVLSGMAGLYEDNLFLTYYHEFMELEPRVLPPAQPAPVPRPMASGVHFEGVTFAYPDTERTALQGITLDIRPGEVAALVGPNGSGKTTLVKLLCRLYDPTAGTISLDGTQLREFDVTELRRHMSVIFQDFSQYQFTARENIRMGNVELAAADPSVEAAARDAGADEVIRSLRNGYETMLGRWFEEGEELSVGEWQKVALARAFVRDAQILVFDEPTSALDPEAEWQIFQHIRELARGRAVVLISHRFSTVRTADRIHILDQGRIVESGSHEELVALDGRYARMYEVQARAYRLEPEAAKTQED